MQSDSQAAPPQSKSKAPALRVLLLYNRPDDGATFQTLEEEHLDQLSGWLSSAGFSVARANLDDEVDRVDDAVIVHRPNIVFLLVDHLWGDNSNTSAVAGMLDLFGYPSVGNDPLALSTCLERARTHAILQQAGIPVTPFAVVRDINTVPNTQDLGFPQIVTQAFDDIYDDSRYRETFADVDSIQQRTREVAEEFDLPLLIERHVPGRRIQACLIGNRVLEVLPLTEAKLDEPNEPITTAALDAETASRVRSLAQRCFRAMGLRDIGQVDFALDDEGNPWVIDVRATVDFFGPIFRTAAIHSDLGVGGTFVAIVKNALERHRAAHPEEVESSDTAQSVDEPLADSTSVEQSAAE